MEDHECGFVYALAVNFRHIQGISHHLLTDVFSILHLFRLPNASVVLIATTTV